MTLSKAKTNWAMQQLYELIPDAKGALIAKNPFELVIAVTLSAQATDISVNKVTPGLFAAYPTPAALAEADLKDIESKIQTIGLYRNKAKYIKACAKMLVEDYHSVVPKTHEELEKLPGVGRKTANVVLGDAFGIPSFAVDTHVTRIAKRLKISRQKATVDEIEKDFRRLLPQNDLIKAHHTLILFGRQYCTARKPKCEQCPLISICATGQKNLNIV